MSGFSDEETIKGKMLSLKEQGKILINKRQFIESQLAKIEAEYRLCKIDLEAAKQNKKRKLICDSCSVEAASINCSNCKANMCATCDAANHGTLFLQKHQRTELTASAGFASAVVDEKGGKVNHKNIARSIVSAFHKNNVLKLYAKSIRRS